MYVGVLKQLIPFNDKAGVYAGNENKKERTFKITLPK